MDTMCIVTMRTAAFGMMGTIVQMPRITRRRKRSTGTHINRNFRGDTVATCQGREYEREEGRMASKGKRRLPALMQLDGLDVLKYGPKIRSGQSPRLFSE